MKEYIDKIELFLENNSYIDNEAEFSMLMYDVVDKMKENNAGIEAIKPILELMERYPLVSFGSPSALVHFMEGFYKKGYEELLECSVKKVPTIHTVWLLNRLINGADEEESREYIQIMKSIELNEGLSKEIRDTTKEFLEYHEEI